MKNPRLLTCCAGLVGLLGITLVCIGVQQTHFPNAWVYLGVLLWAASASFLVVIISTVL